MSQLLGFSVPQTAAKASLEAVGISLERKERRGRRRETNSGRILASALVRLYKKLGEEVPEALSALADRFNRGPTGNNTQVTDPQPAPISIPVKDIPSSKNIRIVNN